VINKLEVPSPLGYSCASEVFAVGENVTSIYVGDFVACGGRSIEEASPIPFDESYHSTLATFKTIQSIIENRLIKL
jgi:NADPH:quinone reductase-like Zn-dependent oxidoreductase